MLLFGILLIGGTDDCVLAKYGQRDYTSIIKYSDILKEIQHKK